MNREEHLQSAIASVPVGRWGVAVSGGADSVALLHLLHTRTDLKLVVVHLDHETRAGQSTEDARFVSSLASSLSLPLVLSTRSAIESQLPNLPTNRQARYRALRLELYRQAIQQHHLQGILLAHHADDQAETVLMRLLRGAGIEGLRGIPRDAVIAGIRILRPLLAVPRQDLRQFLIDHAIHWREDLSNASPQYQRNRIRILLANHPNLVQPLLSVAAAFDGLSGSLERQSPELPSTFALRELQGKDPLVQFHAIRKWLLNQGVPGDAISLSLLERVRTMVEDSASPPAIQAPGAIELRRRAGKLTTRRSAPPRSAPHPSAPERPDPPEAMP